MAKTIRHIDGDTTNIDDERVRYLGIDTAESVHVDSTRNKEQGTEASKFTKAVAPANKPEELQVERFGKDIFNRRLGNVSRNINGTEIDVQLMLMDQGHTNYVNTYGNNPNPSKHENHQNYMSNYSKFRLGEKVPMMDKENFGRMTELHTNFDTALKRFDDGAGTQEELDEAIVSLYGNESDVVQYRQTLYELNAPAFDNGSLRYASDHHGMTDEQIYIRNLAVANTGTISPTTFKLKTAPTGSAVGAAFSKFNTVANAIQWSELHSIRKGSRVSDVDYPTEQLIDGLDANYHEIVLDEAEENGDIAGVALRDQIIQDMKDNTLWDNLAWYEQLGYGGIAYMVDPVSVGAGALGKTMYKATPYAYAAAKTWMQMGANVGVSATRWATMGAAEETARASIRWGADETYTAKDAQMDIIASTLITGMLPIAGHAIKGVAKGKLGGRWEDLKKQRAKQAAEFDKHIETRDTDKVSTEVVGDHVINSETGEIVEFKYKAEQIQAMKAIEGEEPNITTVADLEKVDAVSDQPVDNQAKHYLRGIAKTEEDYQKVLADAGTAYLQRLDDSINSGQAGIKQYKDKDQKAFHGMDKTLADWVSDTVSLQWAGDTFRDVATRFQKSGLDSLEYIGLNVTESARGFGGKISRRHTAALIKDSVVKKTQTKLLPQYNRAVNEYAASKGKSIYGRFQAEWQSGTNKTANDFHREVMVFQEARRLGKTLPKVHASVSRYADEWDTGFSYAHDQMVAAKLPNFTSKRKVKNYIPRQWRPDKLHNLYSKIGKGNVTRLLTKAFNEMNVRRGDTMSTAKKGVDGLLENIESSNFSKFRTSLDDTGDVDDAFTPSIDLHSRERLDLDMTTSIEVDGVEYSLLDLINTELPEIATKYVERMSGYIGLSKSTNGAITNPLDIKTFRQTIKNEAIEKGKSQRETSKALSMYDDVMDQLFGRPTRRFASEGTLSKGEQLLTGNNYTGISKNLRQLKDLTALTQLGGLGAAQAGETGNAIVRMVMEAFNDPTVIKALYKKSGIDVDDPAEMMRVTHEIMAQTGIDKDIKFLQRQSVHLDQARKEELSKLMLMADTVVDVATFGKHKAQASYALAKVTGFNAVRTWQHGMAQSATTLSIVRHAFGGKSTMPLARIKDLGLDTPRIMENIKKHVEVNSKGYPVAMNFDKWSPEALDDYTFGVHRDAIQAVQQSLVGETPAYLSRPMMQVALQYMEMPIVAMNKQLGRQVAFADKEAAVAMVLAGSVAGIVRYSWDYLNDKVTDTPRKVQDIDSLETLVGSDLFKAVQYSPHLAYMPNILEHLSGKHGIPIMGTLENMYNAAGEGYELARGEGSAKDFIDSAHRLVPLGTTIYAKGVAELTMQMADNLED